MSTIVRDDPYVRGAQVRCWAMPIVAIGVVGALAGAGATFALWMTSGLTAAVEHTGYLWPAIMTVVSVAGAILTLVADGIDSQAMTSGHLPSPAPDQPTRARRMLQTEHLTWLPTTVVLSLIGIAGVIYLGYGVTLAVSTAIVTGQWVYVRRLRRRLGIVMNRRFLPRLRR